MDQPRTRHQRVRQRGSFLLDLPPEEAIKLFTAEGERLWVPDWEPEILGPLPQVEGLVFLTGKGPQQTIWTVLESNSAAGRMRYSRVTPNSKAGIVAVHVTSVGQGSNVDVSYDLTSLNDRDEQSLDAFSPSGFASMMEEWRMLIERMLTSSRPKLGSLAV